MGFNRPAASEDRYDRLRRAQEAMRVVDESTRPAPDAPKANKPAAKAGAKRVYGPAAQQAAAEASGEAANYAAASLPKAVERPSLSNSFSALKLAHQKLGLSQRNEPAADGEAPKPIVVTKGVSSLMSEVNREAQLKDAHAMIDRVADYYQYSASEREEEKARVSAMTMEETQRFMKAYGVISHHVQSMTSEAYARKAAISANYSMQAFYELNGTTEEQLMAERLEKDKATQAKRPRRRGAP